eukprot:SAG11_NODE_11820_length_736_cov_1.852433_1_plen_27_part_10
MIKLCKMCKPSTSFLTLGVLQEASGLC